MDTISSDLEDVNYPHGPGIFCFYSNNDEKVFHYYLHSQIISLKQPCEIDAIISILWKKKLRTKCLHFICKAFGNCSMDRNREDNICICKVGENYDVHYRTGAGEQILKVFGI